MIENEIHKDNFMEVSFGFIFNIRVNPDIHDGVVRNGHPEGKIVIPNDNFGIN